MKIANTLRALTAALAFATAAQASAAPILLVDSKGILTGATGVNVGGALYNVTFADESCISLFNGCVQSAFSFNNRSDALIAANALLAQVFVNGPAGQFDTQPSKIFGCSHPTQCGATIPYSISGNLLLAVAALNEASQSNRVVPVSYSTRADLGSNSNSNFALFQLAPELVEVPEPASIVLFGVAIAGLALSRRRRS